MPNLKSAAKRMRQNEKRRERNRVSRGRPRSYIKQARAAVAAGDFEAAEALTALAIKALDKAAQKGTIHGNNAARRKSRLVKLLAAARTAEE